MALAGRIGGIDFHRIVESEEPDVDVGFLLPDATPETLAPHRAWLEPRFHPPWAHRSSTRYLDNLAAIGLAPPTSIS